MKTPESAVPRSIVAGELDVAYLESGPSDGAPVVLLHGFPYEARAFDRTAGLLAARGLRVIVPWLRGFGATRFLDAATPRSGQQGALAADLLALMDALELEQALLGGYDWGGRAACIVAALWPDRVRGLVTGGGFNIQDLRDPCVPAAPEVELRLWYHWYFHGERGRAGLEADRAAFIRQLWRLWSPTWTFTEADFATSSPAWDNPDFVDVVIHSYRHRYGLAPGNPAFDLLEARLAAGLAAGATMIPVPTIGLAGDADGVTSPEPRWGRERFGEYFSGRTLKRIGHNLPQEAPDAFAEAVLHLSRRGDRSPEEIT